MLSLRRIPYDEGYAGVLAPPQYGKAEVIIDPRRSFGVPIFAAGAARVEVVLGRFTAGEAVDELSDEFDVPVDELIDVIRVTPTPPPDLPPPRIRRERLDRRRKDDSAVAASLPAIGRACRRPGPYVYRLHPARIELLPLRR